MNVPTGFFGDSGNPASGGGVVPDTASRSNSAGRGNPNGMGTEGQAIGVITALSIEGESLPPNSRTIQEPDGEWLK